MKNASVGRAIVCGTVIAAGCTTPLPVADSGGVPDALSLDAANIDAMLVSEIDARPPEADAHAEIDASGGEVDAHQVDAGLSMDAFVAPDTHSPPDAFVSPDVHSPPDAFVPPDASCLAPRIRCGAECVDLNTDPSNCGACGYEVLGARTCVSGEPTPAWVGLDEPVAVRTASTGAAAAAWTGRHFVAVVGGGDAWSFDPESGSWTDVSDPPVGVCMGCAVGAPDRIAAFFLAEMGVGVMVADDSGAALRWRSEAVPAFTAGASFGQILYEELDVGAVSVGRVIITGSSAGGMTNQHLIWNPDAPATGWSDVTGDDRVECDHLSVGDGLITRYGGYVGGSVCSSLTYRAAGVGSWSPDQATQRGVFGTDNRNGHSMLPVGDALFVLGGWRTAAAGGGTSAEVFPAVLYRPAGAASVTERPLPGTTWVYSYAFEAFTGRAIIVFGGGPVTRDGVFEGATPTVSNTTWMRRVDDDAQPVGLWSQLEASAPASGTPPGPRGDWGPGNPHSQGFWTGHEFIVFGGRDGRSIYQTTGARLQPRVGCVCPTVVSATLTIDQSGCVGVSSIADNTCSF